MLKKRIMGVVVVREGIAVQSLGFKHYLPVGRPEIAVEFLNRWGVDEIAVIDITAGRDRRINFDLIEKVAPHCQVPLTYGGGIASVEDMTRLVQAGADKVMVNQAFLRTPELVTAGAHALGSQCVVVSMDLVSGMAGAQPGGGGARGVWNYREHALHEGSALNLCRQAEECGAGEIFINNVEHDGMKCGYDLEAVAEIGGRVGLPLTLCGGVGHVRHFAEGLRIPQVSAVAAANFFHFTEHAVTLVKSALLHGSGHSPPSEPASGPVFGLHLRLDTAFDYRDSHFDADGRIMRKPTAVLQEMLFEYHPEEVI